MVMNMYTNDDEVRSADFSDFDEPYHETASDWLRRSARRRARRLAGLSSCSSSGSSGSSDESVEEGERATAATDGEIKYKSIIKWQRGQYPIAAARACLSLASHSDDNNSTRRSPRERECNKLNRLLCKIRRKQLRLSKQQPQQHQQERGGGGGGTIVVEERCNDDFNNNHAHIANDKLVIDSFLPRGTGIHCIDAALDREKVVRSRRGGTTSCSLVLEMTGSRRSGKSTTLLAIAARYAASTTNSFFCDGDDDEVVKYEPKRISKRQRRYENYAQTPPVVVEPRIVILDIDLCVNPIKLMLVVREAVLRRFHETSVARKWIRKLLKESDAKESVVGITTTTEDSKGQLDDELSAREKKMIERTITSCLGRINIVQPRDFTYLSLVATMETLRQSLDHERNDKIQNQAPTLIMIDSMSTLDACTQFQESLPTKSSHSGLSDRNEFYRQLIRLRDCHEVAIIGTSLTTAGRCSIWDKIVTHRVSIERGMNY